MLGFCIIVIDRVGCLGSHLLVRSNNKLPVDFYKIRTVQR
jgi:hypothetical protein